MALPPPDISDADGPAWIEYDKERQAHLLSLTQGSDTSAVPTFEQYQQQGGFSDALAVNQEALAKQARFEERVALFANKDDEVTDQQSLIKYNEKKQAEAESEERIAKGYQKQRDALEFAKSIVNTGQRQA